MKKIHSKKNRIRGNSFKVSKKEDSYISFIIRMRLDRHSKSLDAYAYMIDKIALSGK